MKKYILSMSILDLVVLVAEILDVNLSLYNSLLSPSFNSFTNISIPLITLYLQITCDIYY